MIFKFLNLVGVIVFGGTTLFGASCLGFSYQTLQSQIENDKIDSIEKLLPTLPASLRSKYVLIFQSRSLQGASPQNPRVILFGEDAKLLLSFNGSPSQRGFNELEVAEFDNLSKQFTFHEILFPDATKDRKGVNFSKENPERCIKCHGNPGRAIWDTHPTWPGAYGQIYHSALSKSEEEGLSAFLIEQKNHARYRYLTHLETFANRDTFAPTTNSRYEGSDRHLPPNAAFGKLLSNLNLQMIAREVGTSANFSQYQYALLATLSNECGSLESYIPSNLRSDFTRNLKEFSQVSEIKNRLQEDKKLIRLVGFAKVSQPSSEKLDLSSFRYIARTGLHLSTDDWTLALEKQTYDFTAPDTAAKVLEAYLLPYAFKNDSSLQHADSLRAVNSDDRYCEELKRKSQVALSLSTDQETQPVVPRSVVENDVPTLLKRCSICHDGSIGRQIQFESSQQLAKQLNESGFTRGTLLQEILYRLSPKAGYESMPRGLNLNPEEYIQLRDYFQRLAGQNVPTSKNNKNF